MESSVPGRVVHVPTRVEQLVPSRVEHWSSLSRWRVPGRVVHVPSSTVQLFRATRNMFLARRYKGFSVFSSFFLTSISRCSIEVGPGLPEDREVLEAPGMPPRGLHIQPRLHLSLHGVLSAEAGYPQKWFSSFLRKPLPWVPEGPLKGVSRPEPSDPPNAE
jgi:hypothetical protein